MTSSPNEDADIVNSHIAKRILKNGNDFSCESSIGNI